MTEAYAWVGDALVPREEARLSIDDFAVRYGAACFETMLARNGRMFRLDRHLDRLEGGLRLMGVTSPEREYVEQAVRETLRANALTEASVRLTVTAGSGGAPDLDAASAPEVVVTADAYHPPSDVPVRLAVVSTRLDEHRPWRSAKVSQFLPYLLARQEARALGADDALMLDHAGHIAEAATANIFLLLDDALVTPSLECGPLPGVTREAVLELARAEGIPVAEGEFGLEALMGASVALLTSSLGLRRVASIVGRAQEAPVAVDWSASAPSHPTLGWLERAYAALVEQETETS